MKDTIEMTREEAMEIVAATALYMNIVSPDALTLMPVPLGKEIAEWGQKILPNMDKQNVARVDTAFTKVFGKTVFPTLHKMGVKL